MESQKILKLLWNERSDIKSSVVGNALYLKNGKSIVKVEMQDGSGVRLSALNSVQPDVQIIYFFQCVPNWHPIHGTLSDLLLLDLQELRGYINEYASVFLQEIETLPC